MTLFDISRRISPQTAVWPGDQPHALEHVLRKREGYAVNLTTLHLSPHTATHADAPYHFNDAGAHPDSLPLGPFIGQAQVVWVERQQGGITPADLDGQLHAPVQRVLLRTWVSALPDEQFAENFPYPTLALVDWLAEQGAVLLGVDMPSVDDFHSSDLPCHHRLAARGLAHLENLWLRDVPPGLYELIALPLRLAGACGSPVRAILRTL
ncbi:MAG: kynurenine formamidase [Anaerolineae bacterium]|nr:kynurenine formamidase [Anaerolineae bacterium]